MIQSFVPVQIGQKKGHLLSKSSHPNPDGYARIQLDYTLEVYGRPSTSRALLTPALRAAWTDFCEKSSTSPSSLSGSITWQG